MLLSTDPSLQPPPSRVIHFYFSVFELGTKEIWPGLKHFMQKSEIVGLSVTENRIRAPKEQGSSGSHKLNVNEPS